MRIYLSFSVMAMSLAAAGCGSKSNKKVFPLEAADLQAELAAQSTTEAISAAASGDAEGSANISFALESATTTNPFRSISRVCEVQSDGSAKVTITSDMNFNKSLPTARMSWTSKMSGSSLETRLWSKTGGVACAGNNTYAAIDWNADITGVSLVAHVERSREHVVTQTNLVRNTTMSRSRSFSIKGDRNVSFSAASTTGGQITRTKQVSGKVTNSFKFVDKNGQEQSGELTSETVQGYPLVINVIRNAASKELVSREIVSGKRINTSADGSKVEVSFTNFLIGGEGETCALQSGALSLRYLSASDAAIKVVACTVDTGALSCTDDAGAVVEIENPSCDPLDAR